MLSGTELFKHRQGLDKTVPEKGGLKDYMPQGTWLENKRLQKFHEEREQVLAEPRIQRKSDWVKGTWIPEKQLVELFHEMRNFWQHMGFVDRQQKWLYPEEALSLMETNVLEVWYGGVSLSLQEAYALLLGNGVSQEMYQVYCHLRRIGYVVLRHQGRSEVTAYERKIRLDKYSTGQNMKNRSNKRKEATLQSYKDGDADSIPAKCAKEVEETDEQTKAKNSPEEEMLGQTDNITTDEGLKEDCNSNDHEEVSAQEPHADRNRDNNGEALRNTGIVVDRNQTAETCASSRVGMTEESKNKRDIISDDKNSSDPGDPETETEMDVISDNKNSSDHTGLENSTEGFKSTLWNFEEFNFPDFGVSCDTVVVTAPSHGQLLGNLEFTSSEYTFQRQSWINNRADKMQKRGEAVLEFSYPDIMHAEYDRTVVYKNWRELKESFQQKRKAQVRQWVVPQLYEDGLCPLVKAERATSTRAVLDQLYMIKEDTTVGRLEEAPETLPDFDVYLPNVKFKKSQPGLPDHRVCVARCCDAPPDLGVVTRIHQYLRDEVPLHWAVVDSGDIAFIVMSDFTLPRDITTG